MQNQSTYTVRVFYVFAFVGIIRYITIEELEHALKEFGMGSDKDIKEIVSEVDADNVRNTTIFQTYS